MTNAELISKIQWQLSQDVRTKHVHEKTVIGHVLDALGIVAGAALFDGVEVPLPHLGKLETRDRKARRGRNPQTGAAIVIPASRTVVFRPGKTLKHIVNC